MMPTTTRALSTMSCGLVEDVDYCFCTIGVVDAASTQKALLLVWSVGSNRVSPNLLANPSHLAFQSTVLMLVIRILVNINILDIIHALGSLSTLCRCGMECRQSGYYVQSISALSELQVRHQIY